MFKLTSYTPSTRSCHVLYDQDSPPAGFTDKVYVANFHIPNEAASGIGLVHVTDITTATDNFDIPDLEPGRTYYVRIFRYVGGVLTASTPYHGSWVYNDATLSYIRTLYESFPVVTAKNRTIDFDPLTWNRDWYDQGMAAFVGKQPLFDAALGGKSVRITDPDLLDRVTYNDGVTPPVDLGYVFGLHAPIPQFGYEVTFEQKMRFSAFSGSPTDPFFSFTPVYAGENEYAGLYCYTGLWTTLWGLAGDFLAPYIGTCDIHEYDGDRQGCESNGGTYTETPDYLALVPNHVYNFKWIYTPGATRNDLAYCKVYVDDVLYYQGNIIEVIHAPFGVWMGGRAGVAAIDIGPLTITMTQDDTKLYTGLVNMWQVLDHCSVDFNQCGVMLGKDYSNTESGGITAKFTPGANWLWMTAGNTFTSGAFGMTFPAITPPAGYQTTQVVLLGRQTCGYVKVQFKDTNGVLISDSVIPGNSTGFFPNNNTERLTVNVNTQTPIVPVVSGNYDGTSLGAEISPSILHSIEAVFDVHPHSRISGLGQGGKITGLGNGGRVHL